jgi:competence protein ComEA
MKQKIDSSRQLAAKGMLLCALSMALAMVLTASHAQAAKPASSAPPLTGVVNLNTATPEQLQLLPGVGEARAVAIVQIRKDRGGFKQVEDLLAVKGIGETMLERMRPFVTLTGKTTARKL